MSCNLMSDSSMSLDINFLSNINSDRCMHVSVHTVLHNQHVPPIMIQSLKHLENCQFFSKSLCKPCFDSKEFLHNAIFINREEETKRWDPKDDLNQDCGVYAFLKNLSIGMFTMSCDDKLRLLCEFGMIIFLINNFQHNAQL